MPLMPSTIDHYDIVSDDATVYNIGLLTAIPSTTWVDYQSLNQPTDIAYVPQPSLGEITEQDLYSVSSELSPVEFDGSYFASPVTVVGYWVAATYDNGYILMTVQELPVPYTLQAGSDVLTIGGTLTAMKTFDQTDIKWS